MAETISINDFQKVELRIGKVKSAEPVPGADKILKLQVDIGTETRQIIAGIAKEYAPKELVGKIIVVVTNLTPKTVRGVESRGMLLTAVDGDTAIILTTDRPAKPGLPVM